MRLVILSAAALAVATLAVAPAVAQVVVKERVTVGERHDDNWRRHHNECRVVKVRTRLPNGNVIIKTRRSC
jgi:pyrimidine deaminase RibD-like protein